MRERQRVAERDQLGRALRGHDPGEPCGSPEHRPSAARASREAVSGAIRTTARARARRRETGLSPTSTIRTATRVVHVRKLAHCPKRYRRRGARDATVEVGELSFDPAGDVVLAHVSADRLQPLVPLRLRHRESPAQGLGLAGHVERVHANDPVLQLLVCPGVLGEDHNAVPLVHQGRFLRDEVHAVEDRVDEEDVELFVGGDRSREVVLDAHLDRHPAAALEPVVHAPRLALDRGDVLGVLGDVLPGRVEQGEHPDPAVRVGLGLEVELVGAEAAHDVLRRVGPVDAEDQLLRPPLDQLTLGREHRLALRQLLELGRVDGDRMDADERAPPACSAQYSTKSHSAPRRSPRRAKEVDPPAVGVEPDHVVREEPVVDRGPHPLREHVPVVRLRPRDVDEMREQRVRRTVADESRREIEVVVVEEHRRLGCRVQLLDDRVREPLVHPRVAVCPRVLERDVDRRRVRKLPEVVLQEPEHRVRDDVVEPVVRRRVVLDEPQPDGRAVAEALVDRALGSNRAVLVAHRARDPGDVVMGHEPAKSGDEPAASATRHALAVLARVGDRPAIRDDDQVPAIGRHDWTLSRVALKRRPASSNPG